MSVTAPASSARPARRPRAADVGPGGVVYRFGQRRSVRIRVRSAVVCGVLVAATLTVGVLAIGTGDYPMSVGDVIRTLLGGGTAMQTYVVESLRVPRVLTGMLVGGALGASGAVFQSLARNPLGSPDVVGFTTGSATGALVFILILGGGTFAVASASIVGGVVTALAVYALAYRRGVQGYRLVLVGIAVAALLRSVNSYLLTRADITNAQQAAVWMIGNLNARGWENVVPVAAALAMLLPVLAALSTRLRMMEMGDEVARGLGVVVERDRLALLLVAIGLAAVATASAGPIPFVALAAPQVARRLTGAAGPGVAAAALAGALLLVASDFAAQRVMAPRQLPVGVATSLLGGVYLAWLLHRDWRRQR